MRKKILLPTKCKSIDNSAQAVQVLSMINSYPENKVTLDVIRLKKYLIGSKFIYYLKISYQIFKNRYDLIICRDIVVCFFSIISNTKVLYEAHTIPNKRIVKIHKIFSKNNNVYIGGITYSILRLYKEKFGYKNGLILRSGVFDKPRSCSLELRNYLVAILKKKSFDIKKKSIIMHTGSVQLGRGVELCKNLLFLENIIFVQVGGELSDVQRIRKELGDLSKKFVWVKRLSHEKTLEMQCMADVLFYILLPEWPTYKIASSLKIMEYLSSGVPVIGSSGGSAAEIFDKSYSFTKEEPDGADIVSLYKKCLKSKSNYEDIALHNFKLSRKYTWEKRWSKILNYFF